MDEWNGHCQGELLGSQIAATCQRWMIEELRECTMPNPDSRRATANGYESTTLTCDDVSCVIPRLAALSREEPGTDPNEPADEADALWRALRCAEQAFEKSLEENNLDPVYFAHRFTGMILSIDFATITETITVDDLERRLTRSEEPPDA